jgi:hypothetical protein
MLSVGGRESRLGQREGKARLDKWGHVYFLKTLYGVGYNPKAGRPERREGQTG